MKKVGFLGFILAFALLGSVARADHNDPQGSVGLLHSEAEELEQLVSYSYLSYNVKQSVASFSGAVSRLFDCVSYGSRIIFHDHTDEVGVPYRCAGQLQNAKYSFAQVSRYLSDTQYDFPQIYNQWRQTYSAVNSINVSGVGPGPGPGSYSCVASDRGWEEHGAGHQGYGRSLQQAQRSALVECQRYHGQCVIRRCN